MTVSTVDFSAVVWRTSSFTGNGDNGNCVEIAYAPLSVGVRDTKLRSAGHLTFTEDAWGVFVARCRRAA